MTDEFTPNADEFHPGQVSRRSILGIAAALGIAGVAGFELVDQAGIARAASYEYIFPSSARTVLSPPPDSTGGSFANHVAHSSSAPGVDYSGNGTTYGSAIVAVKAGTVTYVKSDSSGTYGRQVHVNHGDGSATKYMHLNATSVSEFQHVAQGAQVGTMGGSAAGVERKYGAHIHLCLQIDGNYVDFAEYVEKSPAAPVRDKENEEMARGIFQATVVGSGTTFYYAGTAGGPVVQYPASDKPYIDLLAYTWGLHPVNGGFVDSASCPKFAPLATDVVRLLFVMWGVPTSFALSTSNPYIPS